MLQWSCKSQNVDLQLQIIIYKMNKFIGRQEELRALHELTQLKKASFLVIRGRRRIGKSAIIKEFSKSFDNFYSFSGLAPNEDTTNQQQLDEFTRQMTRECNIPFSQYNDWGDLFWALSTHIKKGKTLILFDEISWMGSKDHAFLSKIKNLWDLQLSQNPNLIFIICGSASSWIDKNILSSTGFVGRISYTMTLKELSLSESSQFWPKNISAYEKLKILSITGGVPKYLEEINPKLTAEENIRRLCFKQGGFLVDEFAKIFSDLFLRNSDFYKNIVNILSTGSKELKEIQNALGDCHGRVSEYLDELESNGFVSKDYTWDLKTGRDSKLRRYRLKDNYLRFYLKYIEKNITQINREAYNVRVLSNLPEWTCIMGLQFENLVINNKFHLYKALGIKLEDIICENPFFQRKTNNALGCQIDYMIQTRFNTIYLCEIKFSQDEIGPSIISEVQQKIDAIKLPKSFSVRPVLIHVNGISERVIEADYFANIVNIAEFLL